MYVGYLRAPQALGLDQSQVQRAVAWLKLVFAVVVLLTACSDYLLRGTVPLNSGMNIRGHSDLLVAYATPFLWLMLVIPSGASVLVVPFSRTLLCLAAILGTLQIIPTAGSQLELGTFPFLLVALICFHDASVTLRGVLPSSRAFSRVFALAQILLLLLPIVGIAESAQAAHKRFTAYEPLPFLGASQMRLNQEEAAPYVSLVNFLKGNCDTFFGYPGVNSLYFWSGIGPPTPLNATHWTRLLSSIQQRSIVNALSMHPGACVFTVDLKGSASTVNSPLLQYIADDFREVDKIGGYELRVSKHRQVQR